MFTIAELRREIDEIDRILTRARWVIPVAARQRALPKEDLSVIDGTCRRVEPAQLPMGL
jgi:hypothetical protein